MVLIDGIYTVTYIYEDIPLEEMKIIRLTESRNEILAMVCPIMLSFLSTTNTPKRAQSIEKIPPAKRALENMKSFFFVSEVNDWAHIYHYDYSGKLINQITDGEWEVVGIDAINPDSEKLYYVSTEESPLERHLYSINFKGKKKKKLTNETGQHNFSVSPNGAYYLDVYSNTNLPTQVEMWSTQGKMLTKIADNQSVNQFISNHFFTIMIFKFFINQYFPITIR